MKKSDREIVFNKFSGKCAYCGCNLEKGWHVDHLIPAKRKLKHDPVLGKIVCTNEFEAPNANREDNLFPSCASCNILKSSQSLEGFRHSIATFINSLNSYTNQYKIAKRYGLVQETGIPVIFYFETLKSDL